MTDRVVDIVNEIVQPSTRLVVIAALFLAAWVVARSSAFLARKLVAWHDRRHGDVPLEQTGKIANLKRRETVVSMIRTAISYGAFATAIVLAVAQLTGGVDRLTALAGASFAVLVAGFAAQRILADLLAGLVMFVERWFAVGDTVVVPLLDVQGVVEDVSLRRTKLRSVNGEAIHVHNSQIPAIRVLPRGVKELAVEFFVRDREQAEHAVRSLTAILPEGPTTFIRRPWIEEVNDLADALVRMRLRATVAPGREWLAENFFPDLLRERLGDVIVHGPVTLAVDDRATRTFARATGALRVAR